MKLDNETEDAIKCLMLTAGFSKKTAIEMLVKFGRLAMVSAVSIGESNKAITEVICSVKCSNEITGAANVYKANYLLPHDGK